jgi:hypothetical protein
VLLTTNGRDIYAVALKKARRALMRMAKGEAVDLAAVGQHSILLDVRTSEAARAVLSAMFDPRNEDPDSVSAAAELYQLAQAHALIRMYRESEGHEPTSTKVLEEWCERRPRSKQLIPTDEDHEAVRRERPDLVRRAYPNIPDPSGNN